MANTEDEKAGRRDVDVSAEDDRAKADAPEQDAAAGGADGQDAPKTDEGDARPESSEKGEKHAGAAPVSRKKRRAARRAEEQKAAATKRADARKKARKKTGVSFGAKLAFVIVASAAMVISISSMACAGVMNEAATKKETGYELTGGVAATVGSVNITEDSITKQVMTTRQSYSSDKEWAQYLVDSDLTPESLREQVINSYADQYIEQQAEAKNGVSISDDEVNKQYDEAVSSMGGQQQFEQTLSLMGMTADQYKQTMKSNLALNALKEKVAKGKEPTDQQVLDAVNKDISTYNDARKSSQLLIKVSDTQTDEQAKKKAQEALDKINSGELSFEDAVAKYSEDDGSKADKGNVGWDKLTSFVTEYQDALSKLSKGQVSGLVKSTYGYHVIKCTDYFHVDGKATSIDQVPSEIRDYVKNTLKTQAESDAYDAWMKEFKKGYPVKINPMPENVPYNVSLKGVTKESGSAAAAGASDADASSGSGAVEGQ